MKSLKIIIIISLVSFSAIADNDSEAQATEFIKLYSTLCLKNINNLEGLRTKLSNLPALPPEKAKLFLSAYTGKAWPIPSKIGKYVIALPDNEDICSVFARNGNTETAKTLFNSLVSTAPSPLISTEIPNNLNNNKLTDMQTLTYMWSLPNNNKGMLFKLTSDNSYSRDLRLMASASIARKE